MAMTQAEKDKFAERTGNVVGNLHNTLWDRAEVLMTPLPPLVKYPLKLAMNASTALLPGGILDNPALFGLSLVTTTVAGLLIGVGTAPAVIATIVAGILIPEFYNSLYDNVPAFKDFVDGLNDLGSQGYESATQMVEDMGEAIGGAIDAIGQAFSDAGEAIIENAEALASLVETAFRDAWAGLQQLYNELPSFDELFTDWSEAFERISDYLENLWGKLICEEQCEVEDLETAAGLTPQTPIVFQTHVIISALTLH